MMNTRVLELLRNPKNIQPEDLHLLKEEINSFPYIQNIRALHLYGVHLYDKDNYQKALSSTAAYTTDKKILYQLINGKIKQVKPVVIVEKQEITPETIIANQVVETKVAGNENLQEEIAVRKEARSFSDHDYEAASEGLIADKPEIKHLVVKGERNRILFEGEENFLDEDHNETIDLESTLESGVIVTHKSVSNQNLSETDGIDAIIAEELAGTSSESEAEQVHALPKTQVEEIADNAELNLEETISESDVDKEAVITEAPKSEIIINEDQIDSKNISEKVNKESEISFQKVESFPTEPDNQVIESTHSSDESSIVKAKQAAEVLNPELIIEEEKIDSEQIAEKINDDAELSFHGTDSFLPEVKIESNKTTESLSSETPKSTINKHEDEMRRLIEEVEKRMKSKKENAPEKTEEAREEEISHDISFAETQAFHVGEEQKAAEEAVVTVAESIVEEDLEKKKAAEDNSLEEKAAEEKASEEQSQTPVNSGWKPMSFEASRPDSLLNKSTETLQQKEEIQTIEVAPEAEPIVEEILTETQSETIERSDEAEEKLTEPEAAPDKQNGEAPVMNVSFFGSDIASLGLSYKSHQKEKADAKEQEEKIAQQKIDDSNVPGFINTWQSWLKIEREEDAPIDKTEIKNKVIESFIENNPKISQLRDEVNFVVKEKTDDISHLMTETLANLYIEQKLYSKAVNAFLILANKFPDRKEYFESKVQEIKDNRNKN